MARHFWDHVKIDSKAFPKYYLTHYNGHKEYAIMVMSWNVEKDYCDGWIFWAEYKTIAECRKVMKNF